MNGLASFYEGMQSEVQGHPNIFASFNDAMDQAALAVRSFSRVFAIKSKRLNWELRIAFCDDSKMRRRMRRVMAREYRRPALIHKGGKP